MKHPMLLQIWIKKYHQKRTLAVMMNKMGGKMETVKKH